MPVLDLSRYEFNVICSRSVVHLLLVNIELLFNQCTAIFIFIKMNHDMIHWNEYKKDDVVL